MVLEEELDEEEGDNNVDKPGTERESAWVAVWEARSAAMLKHVFGKDTSSLRSTVLLIALDAERPWDLESSLKRWLFIAESQMNTMQFKDGELARLKQGIVNRFFAYQEQSSEEMSNSMSLLKPYKTQAPPQQLEEGLLDFHLGISIVVCLTKLDSVSPQQDSMFEYIQQHLRRICLRCTSFHFSFLLAFLHTFFTI